MMGNNHNINPPSGQFKLDTFHQTDSTATASTQRPTIPYSRSQFPRPALHHLSTSLDSPYRSNGEEDSPDIARSSVSIHHPEDDFFSMGGTPSGHRRRRASLMNSVDAGSDPARSTRHTQSPADGILEDAKWSEDDLPWSGDDVMANGDAGRMDGSTDEDGDEDEEAALTGNARSDRKKRRRRDTMTDQRIVGDVKITEEEKKEADQNVVKKMLINGLLIGLWYLFSLSISIYNKWMFDKDHLDFPFPLFTTCMHMLVQFSLSALVLYFIPRFRPRYDSISNPYNTSVGDADRSRHESDSKMPLMSRWFYFTRLGPCGMATALDIGLGNMSLKYISLTFYTMCKSSALAFVLIFAFVFRLETPSWRLVAIIAVMTIGVIMMVAGEVDFKPLGFILVISAAFFSGFRWGLTQILLLRNPATSNPFSSIFYLAPVMFVSLFVIAVPIEGFSDLFIGLEGLVEKKGPFLGPAILLSPGIIAFLMTSSEFALLQRTSVVTLSIAGIFKEVVTILAAGRIFNDTMTVVNFSGLAVTIGAIAGYNYIKITKMREEARLEAHIKYAASSTAAGSGGGHTALGTWERDGDDDGREDVSGAKGKGAESTAPLMGGPA